MKTGIANLPLHYGKAPRWLFSKMTQLARQISIAIIEEYGPNEMLERLSDPFWFQSLGCVLGFDWHSSGVTTTVCGALKEGLKGIQKDLGIFIAGGKGATSRKTPFEIEDYTTRYRLDTNPDCLVYASRLSAKVDNNALQDGYQLYHHCFIFTKGGNWAVIQQGLNEETHWARRYHWLGKEVKDFVCEPHKAICCDHKGDVLNMVAGGSEPSRKLVTELSREKSDKLISEIKKLDTLNLPQRHKIVLEDLNVKHLEKVLLKTYDRQPEDFEKLLGMEGVGPKSIRALSLISELVYGAKPSFRDPVKYSFAHGGKDGHPYFVDRENYAKSISLLRKAISEAKLGNTDKIKAIRRLSMIYEKDSSY